MSENYLDFVKYMYLKTGFYVYALEMYRLGVREGFV